MVAPEPPSEADGAARQDERDRMVEDQLAAPTDRREPVLDPRVLQAMRRVPRHLFVPAELAADAYDDTPLSIGRGQTISQPYVVAKMTELLEIEPGARVLEVGTGSGYQTAVLAELGAAVVTIERDAELADAARRRLEPWRGRVEILVGDGNAGAPDRAPFDAILVTAAPERIPEALEAQLADGGRLVVPVGPPDGDQQLQRIVRSGSRRIAQRLFAVRFVPMVGDAGKPR
jgi:protein-L-isoaspartate(D-aspartate) O-methyltransferase